MTGKTIMLKLIKQALKKEFKEEPVTCTFTSPDLKKVTCGVTFANGLKKSKEANEASGIGQLTEILSEKIAEKLGDIQIDFCEVKLDFASGEIETKVYFQKEGKKEFSIIKDL